ncbi:hypothetical protein B0H19DRAFT_1055197 [Mycena capillaripes]|nr:hypothetical protein B0H19DRAFT_1055197 [Mycena capillaripes]
MFILLCSLPLRASDKIIPPVCRVEGVCAYISNDSLFSPTFPLARPTVSAFLTGFAAPKFNIRMTDHPSSLIFASSVFSLPTPDGDASCPAKRKLKMCCYGSFPFLGSGKVYWWFYLCGLFQSPEWVNLKQRRTFLVSMYAWNTTGLIQVDGISKLKKGFPSDAQDIVQR